MARFGWMLVAAAGCGAPDAIDLEDELEAIEVAEVALGAPAPGGVGFARDTSERGQGVRIRDDEHSHPEVVYSVRLDDLAASERLRLRGEVTLSRCNPKDIAGESGDAATTPCSSKMMKQKPYGYAPRFSATFVLADGPKDAKGKRVAPWSDTVCNDGRHHCALALPEAELDGVDAPQKWLNLVVTADARGHDAKAWHVMEIEHHHGGLYVTRLAPGAEDHAAQADTKKLLAKGKLGIDRPEEDGDPTQVKRLVYQLKLDGLAPHDVIDADVRMHAVLDGGYSCDPLITGTVIVTEDPDARKPKGPHDRALTARNGANCSDHSNDGCRYRKSGAVALGGAAPDTMYLSYVITALRSCAAPDGSDTFQIEDGALQVNLRR